MGTGEEMCREVQVTRSGRKGVIAGQMWEGEKVRQDEMENGNDGMRMG